MKKSMRSFHDLIVAALILSLYPGCAGSGESGDRTALLALLLWGGGAPSVTSYTADAVTATSADLSWTYDRALVGHVDVEAGAAFPGFNYVEPPDYHNTSRAESFSYTATGLVPNTLYSIRISGDIDPLVTPAGPFHVSADFDGAFRTLPDSVEGATGNYRAAVSGASKYNLEIVQTSPAVSFVFWQNEWNEIYAQYLDTSAGTPDTWDRCPAAGTRVFSTIGVTGSYSALAAPSDRALVIGINGAGYSIYGQYVYYAAGSLAQEWPAGAGGILLYQTAAPPTSSACAALTAYVRELTSAPGSFETNYLYDPAAPFGPVAAGNMAINDTSNESASVTSKISDSFLMLSNQVITAGDYNYRIGNNAGSYSAVMGALSAGANLDDSLGVHNVDDLIFNNTAAYRGYITVNLGSGQYTLNKAMCNSGDSYTRYTYMLGGTVVTNTIFDAGRDFTVYPDAGDPVAVGDIVINNTTGASGIVADLACAANGLLRLSATTTPHPFAGPADNYRILRLPTGDTPITSGRTTSTSGGPPYTITQAGRDFNALGVQAGDIVYNVDDREYATVLGTPAPGSDTITISSLYQGNRNFLVYRHGALGNNAATIVWAELDKILGKTVSLATGIGVYPGPLSTDRFYIVNHADPSRNPHIVSDGRGGAIVACEMFDSGTGTWDVRVKKISASGNFLFPDADADMQWDAGIDATSGVPARDYRLRELIQDGSGGAVLTFTDTADTRVGVTHVSATGTATTFSIPNASAPSIAGISGTQCAVAYESQTASGKSIYVQKFNNTPSAVGSAINVRSSNSSYSQVYPKVAGDGSGGAIVSWIENRYYPSIYYSIFAQHFDSDLTRLYGDDRFVAVPVLDNQAAADPCDIEYGVVRYPDGTAPDAGLFIWVDERDADPKNIYFQPVAD